MKRAKQDQKAKIKESTKEELKKVKDYDYDHIDELGKMIGKRNFP